MMNTSIPSGMSFVSFGVLSHILIIALSKYMGKASMIPSFGVTNLWW